ncbi:MAG TPA: FAD-dependent oxidoreductase [Anaeromyxobacteraceae bacterium]
MPLVQPILTKESGPRGRNHCVSTPAARHPVKPLHAARDKLTSIMEPGPLVVAGARPAGLAAALALVRAGREVVVVERGAEVGGLARTVERSGYRFDLGGHRFFTRPGHPDGLGNPIPAVSGGRAGPVRRSRRANRGVPPAPDADFFQPPSGLVPISNAARMDHIGIVEIGSTHQTRREWT